MKLEYQCTLSSTFQPPGGSPITSSACTAIGFVVVLLASIIGPIWSSIVSPSLVICLQPANADTPSPSILVHGLTARLPDPSPKCWYVTSAPTWMPFHR